MVSKRRRPIQPRKPWLKENPPLWAFAIFGGALIVVVVLFVYGVFFDKGGIP